MSDQVYDIEALLGICGTVMSALAKASGGAPEEARGLSNVTSIVLPSFATKKKALGCFSLLGGPGYL